MAYWDGDLTVTISDRMFLYAIQKVDDVQGHSCLNPPRFLTDGVEIMVKNPDFMNHENFQIIVTNKHLRTLLRAFLIANIRVAEQQMNLQRERDKWLLGRLWQQKAIRNLEAGLKDLEVARDQAFKEYEMFRRLTDWDNPWLKRIKA